MELPRAPPSPLAVGKQFDDMKQLKLAVRTTVQGYSLHIQVGLLEGHGLNAKAGNESLLM